MQRKLADSRTGETATARSRARPCAMRGFTLLELMVTLVVGAILLAVAVPDFRRFLSKNDITQTANALVGDLQFARAQASVTGLPVCVVANGGVWAQGWSVTSYDIPTAACVIAPPVLRTRGTLPVNATLSTDQAGNPIAEIIFAPTGNVQLAAPANTNFHFCKTADSQAQRVLVLVIAAGTTSSYRDTSVAGPTCP
ncbi:MAG: GspH/FimT family pseudopilin [Rhodanobacteraceae bacterium]